MAGGDPNEFLGTSEVASLLVYSSTASFSSALYQGRIPELPEPDAQVKEEGSHSPGRNKWRRATVVAVARKRGVLSPDDQNENVDLVCAGRSSPDPRLQHRRPFHQCAGARAPARL
ncbi:hypothetical protein [Streptomyces sp. IMTB 2501]|uniref:hypothetical protein n=1 Tax=Streptomyces sp. IMTB 2501 TaxID=1776340 RepID=UPI002116E8B7|nr:hypothetical protein [Streptomyces sp. IMTB 2501]